MDVQACYHVKSEHNAFYIKTDIFFTKALKYRPNSYEKFKGLGGVQNVRLQRRHKLTVSNNIHKLEFIFFCCHFSSQMSMTFW